MEQSPLGIRQQAACRLPRIEGGVRDPEFDRYGLTYQQRHDLAIELATKEFDPSYLEHRYGVTLSTADRRYVANALAKQGVPVDQIEQRIGIRRRAVND
ncbi:MAG: hypothetical protein ACTHJI_17640 [Leifsonia sp.]